MIKKRFPRYVLVGASAYMTEMTCLYLLLRVAKLTPVTAVAISFWAGFIVAFTLQKLITFDNYERKPKTIAKQLFGYGILVAWNYGFTLLLVGLLAPSISTFAVRTITILIIASWNYYIYHKIFKKSTLPEQF